MERSGGRAGTGRVTKVCCDEPGEGTSDAGAPWTGWGEANQRSAALRLLDCLRSSRSARSNQERVGWAYERTRTSRGPCALGAWVQQFSRQPLLDHDPPSCLKYRSDDTALPSGAGAPPSEEKARDPAVAVGHPARLDRWRLRFLRGAVDALVEAAPVAFAPRPASHGMSLPGDRTCVRGRREVRRCCGRSGGTCSRPS